LIFIDETRASTNMARHYDLEHAGPHYPRDDVRKALAYWKIQL
jgi:hypothetical protein